MSKATIHIHPGFFVYMALCIMLLPIKIIFAWFIASVVHEAGHILCITLMKKEILSFSIKGNGMFIELEPTSHWQESMIALSGPLCGFSLLLISKYMPITAIFAVVQSVYNLLPFYPMDGGRALLGLFRSVFGCKKGLSIYRYFIYAIILILLSVAVILLKSNT